MTGRRKEVVEDGRKYNSTAGEGEHRWAQFARGRLKLAYAKVQCRNLRVRAEIDQNGQISGERARPPFQLNFLILTFSSSIIPSADGRAANTHQRRDKWWCQ